MQKLVLRCNYKQMTKISKALTSELFGPTIKAILTNCTHSMVADKDRRHYTFTFDLDDEYLGANAEKQKESLVNLFTIIKKDEEPDYSSCCHPSSYAEASENRSDFSGS